MYVCVCVCVCVCVHSFTMVLQINNEVFSESLPFTRESEAASNFVGRRSPSQMRANARVRYDTRVKNEGGGVKKMLRRDSGSDRVGHSESQAAFQQPGSSSILSITIARRHAHRVRHAAAPYVHSPSSSAPASGAATRTGKVPRPVIAT